jgi:hypothetical protein
VFKLFTIPNVLVLLYGYNQGILTEGKGSVQLPSLHQIVCIISMVFTFLTKQAIFTRRSTVLSLPLQLVLRTTIVDIVFLSTLL